MNLIFKLSPLVLILAVGACANNRPISPDFGNSVHHNMAMHIINPAPDYAGRPPPAMDGVRAALAMERYQTGEVIEPDSIETSEIDQEGGS